MDRLDDLEIDATDGGQEDEALVTLDSGMSNLSVGDPVFRLSDHVSCEDLLEFACDGPNSRRTRGKARGVDSDEVRIMGKVLGNNVGFLLFSLLCVSQFNPSLVLSYVNTTYSFSAGVC